MNGDLTQGPVLRSMLRFAVPMILGNLLQQCYNIVDTLIVGRVLGADALAAVGSAFTLMTFLTSILLGLCMGSGALFSIRFGQRDGEGLRQAVLTAFMLIALLALLLNLLAFLVLDRLEFLLRVPKSVWPLMRRYLFVVFCGIFASFLYNFFASLLRAIGNSLTPLLFLAVSAVLNIVLDLVFILQLGRGVGGAAEATVLAQYLAGVGLAVYTWLRCPQLRPKRRQLRFRAAQVRELLAYSTLTCVQQSVMNLGILMVQGLVNSFGATVMAAFAAAVKIDAFAYMPVQDFGNAFSTFIAQNYGAGNRERIRAGLRGAICVSAAFSLFLSLLVFCFPAQLMRLFVDGAQTDILAEGVRYLRIEGAFYIGIGLLFLLYGLYRAIGRPGMSVVLTVLSLGTRVALAYALSALPAVGVVGIWWSVPIGWALADGFGLLYYARRRNRLFPDT